MSEFYLCISFNTAIETVKLTLSFESLPWEDKSLANRTLLKKGFVFCDNIPLCLFWCNSQMKLRIDWLCEDHRIF